MVKVIVKGNMIFEEEISEYEDSFYLYLLIFIFGFLVEFLIIDKWIFYGYNLVFVIFIFFFIGGMW